MSGELHSDSSSSGTAAGGVGAVFKRGSDQRLVGVHVGDVWDRDKLVNGWTICTEGTSGDGDEEVVKLARYNGASGADTVDVVEYVPIGHENKIRRDEQMLRLMGRLRRREREIARLKKEVTHLRNDGNGDDDDDDELKLEVHGEQQQQHAAIVEEEEESEQDEKAIVDERPYSSIEKMQDLVLVVEALQQRIARRDQRIDNMKLEQQLLEQQLEEYVEQQQSLLSELESEHERVLITMQDRITQLEAELEAKPVVNPSSANEDMSQHLRGEISEIRLQLISQSKLLEKTLNESSQKDAQLAKQQGFIETLIMRLNDDGGKPSQQQHSREQITRHQSAHSRTSSPGTPVGSPDPDKGSSSFDFRSVLRKTGRIEELERRRTVGNIADSDRGQFDYRSVLRKYRSKTGDQQQQDTLSSSHGGGTTARSARLKINTNVFTPRTDEGEPSSPVEPYSPSDDLVCDSK